MEEKKYKQERKNIRSWNDDEGEEGGEGERGEEGGHKGKGKSGIRKGGLQEEPPPSRRPKE